MHERFLRAVEFAANLFYAPMPGYWGCRLALRRARRAGASGSLDVLWMRGLRHPHFARALESGPVQARIDLQDHGGRPPWFYGLLAIPGVLLFFTVYAVGGQALHGLPRLLGSIILSACTMAPGVCRWFADARSSVVATQEEVRIVSPLGERSFLPEWDHACLYVFTDRRPHRSHTLIALRNTDGRTSIVLTSFTRAAEFVRAWRAGRDAQED